MLRKNDVFEMTCDAFGQDAQGVCRHEGMAVFVPGMLPGERALVRIVKPEKRYAFGRVERLIKTSPDRRDPPCPIYKRCGGCSCQHMSYEASLRFKREQVQALLERVGGLSIEVPPVLGMAHPFAYRNKGAYPVAQGKGGPACGFFAPRSHDLVPLPEGGCLIQGEDSACAVQAVLQWMRQAGASAYDETTGRGLVRHIMTRSTTAGGLMVVPVVTDTHIPQPELLIRLLREAVPGLESVCLSVNRRRTNVILGDELHTLWGKPVMEDTLGGLRFSVSPLSFFQVNPAQTERLYGLALEYAQLTGSETVVDAYCGAGTISLLLAQKAKRVIGIEIVPQAIDNARENAARNGITNAEFLVGATEELLPRLVAEGLAPDVIVIDPPRKGCERAVLDAILAARPKRVVYVSCGAPTLARDAKIFCEGGYTAQAVQCVDMFCWTGAVETVMSLVQQKPDDIVKVGIDADELAVTKAESKATYGEIQARVKEQTGLNVTPLYIAQVKRKYGIIERECYNKAKSESAKMLICPPDKEKAIEDALRFFGMIA
ncbi:MAG: 23S rRNA (uracil(1939)-C(5))-methyltransferase RlmD [Clostridiales bacterium]|nr:23S rRNA (uracil(1939)-C(5))-methyltransferase RlmD [Clostridiales bacterium]